MLEAKTIPAPDGASARSIYAHIVGGIPQNGDYPRDAGDFLRCARFLRDSGLEGQIGRMSEVNAYWEALVPRWDDLMRLTEESVTELIKKIVGPIESQDPGHISLNAHSHMRLGPITFMGVDAAEPNSERSKMTIRTTTGEVTTDFNEEVLTASIKANLAGTALTNAQVEAMTKKKPDPKAPEFPVTKDHNYAVTAEELRQFIERAEQLEAERKDIADQEKELFAEAKGRGYDTKVMKKVIALRKRKPDEIAEEEAVLEMYCNALGMS